MTSNSAEIVRRLKAWKSGRPAPRGSTLHFPLPADGDILIAAFVRMGGESSPWGIVLGHPGRKPKTWTVPEARNRDLVGDMISEVAPLLLAHFHHPDFSDDSDEVLDGEVPLRQLWLPNPSHLDMLHYINYTYAFTRWGDADRSRLLRATGRLSGFLFREAKRPGQVTVMVATEVLRESHSFPAEDVRQGHLGFLLAWLQTQGARGTRMKAAQDAEALSIGSSLDPALERDQLQDLVDGWNAAVKNSDEKGARLRARDIQASLTEELERRFHLVERSITCLREDPREANGGVTGLAQESIRQLASQYLRLELKRPGPKEEPPFTPSPETDRNPAAAAAMYYLHEASEEARVAALVHDDKEMQLEVIADGEGIEGEVVSVEEVKEGRVTHPVWTLKVRDLYPLRVREGAHLCVAGAARREVHVQSIVPAGPGELRVQVEVVAQFKDVSGAVYTRVYPASDRRYIGRVVRLLPTSMESIPRLKSSAVWNKDVPGAWLTHAKPGAQVEESE